MLCGDNVPGNNARMMLIVIDDEPLPTLNAPASIEVTETEGTQNIDIELSVNTPHGHLPDPDSWRRAGRGR